MSIVPGPKVEKSKKNPKKTKKSKIKKNENYVDHIFLINSQMILFLLYKNTVILFYLNNRKIEKIQKSKKS